MILSEDFFFAERRRNVPAYQVLYSQTVAWQNVDEEIWIGKSF
jgi:hypothetical protein